MKKLKLTFIKNFKAWRLFIVPGISYWMLPIIMSLTASIFEFLSFAAIKPVTDLIEQNSAVQLWESSSYALFTAFVPNIIKVTPIYSLIFFIGLVVLFRLARVSVEYFQTVFVSNRTYHFNENCQNFLFKELLNTSTRFFSTVPHSDIMHVQYDAEQVVFQIGRFETLIHKILLTFAHFSSLIWLSYKGTIAVVLLVPVIYLVMKGIENRALKIMKEIEKIKMNIRARADDQFRNISWIKVSSSEEEAQKDFRNVQRTISVLSKRKESLLARRWPLKELIVLGLAFLGFLFYILLTNNVNPTVFAPIAGFLIISQQGIENIISLRDKYIEISMQNFAVERFLKIFKKIKRNTIPDGDIILTESLRTIEIKNLRYRYTSQREIINNLSLNINIGTSIAIVGETGSGKSTLLRLMARELQCPPGSIFFNNIDICKISSKSLLPKISYLSQNILLFHRNIKDNLTIGLKKSITEEKIWEILEIVRLKDVIFNSVNQLSSMIGKDGLHLSGGERQRLAIARALLRDWELLVLDEATSALDSITERKVIDYISSTLNGRSVVAVAHRLSTIREFDKIAVMNSGQIVEFGTWEQLIQRNDIFFNLVEAQKLKA